MLSQEVQGVVRLLGLLVEADQDFGHGVQDARLLQILAELLSLRVGGTVSHLPWLLLLRGFDEKVEKVSFSAWQLFDADFDADFDDCSCGRLTKRITDLGKGTNEWAFSCKYNDGAMT